MFFETFDSPVGTLTVEASETAVWRLLFAQDSPAPGATSKPNSLTRLATQQLEEYFAGKRRNFALPLAEPFAQGSLSHHVLVALTHIPYGATASYAELARTVGNPRAARAVGSACARNPVPILRPCHRVIRADGSGGAYRGGSATKRWLLDFEKATL
ncbi:methylated-DNA--[protein]-cysteine S-methyltransferase [Corynebacterium phocae]|nr:methylated-DNA--[protein]-cysteine S-methyltransferase [Corynebacterium phocae]